jgi:hypothetical protein
MDYVARVALAKRLEEVEAEPQQAMPNLDGSLTARTRYAHARAAYREAVALVLEVLASGHQRAAA